MEDLYTSSQTDTGTVISGNRLHAKNMAALVTGVIAIATLMVGYAGVAVSVALVA